MRKIYDRSLLIFLFFRLNDFSGSMNSYVVHRLTQKVPQKEGEKENGTVGSLVAVGVRADAEPERDPAEPSEGGDRGGVRAVGVDEPHEARAHRAPVLQGLRHHVEGGHGVAARRPRVRVRRPVGYEGGARRHERRHRGTVHSGFSGPKE